MEKQLAIVRLEGFEGAVKLFLNGHFVTCFFEGDPALRRLTAALADQQPVAEFEIKTFNAGMEAERRELFSQVMRHDLGSCGKS